MCIDTPVALNTLGQKAAILTELSFPGVSLVVLSP